MFELNMVGALCSYSTPMCTMWSHTQTQTTWTTCHYFPRKAPNPNPNPSPAPLLFYKVQSLAPLSTFPLRNHKQNNTNSTHFFCLKVSASASASSSPVGSTEYTKEPATNVEFQSSLTLPGCSSSLSLLGTGYREKVFAIIGVKVYAAGLYVNPSISSSLDAWKGQSIAVIQKNSDLFTSIFHAPLEKSLQIVLVRDVDGKTFWDALDDAISPRIKSPTPVDKSALSTFRAIFQDRPLRKGTFIFLTWLDPSEMLVCVSSERIPSRVDSKIESTNVAFALFDVFFGDAPVSPSLKASVANGLATILKGTLP